MVLIRRPFSPNPFLPLHNFQRRFDFLGTQMHCFTEKHIRFGRSFTSQGANSLLLMDSEHRLSPARTDTPFNVPVPNGNRVEICLKLSHISAGIKRERRQRRLSPCRSISQVSGHHVDELRIGRRLAQLRTGDHIQKVMVELVPAALDQRAEIALHTTSAWC